MRASRALCCAAALVFCFAASTWADEWNKKTYLTFSGPVQIPGATLPAGTYTFELANPDSTRHVIRVSSQDGAKTYGLFITLPNERLDPPEENVVMFAERPAGSPKAIKVWFYPGDKIGEEFVYPRKQAVELARATHDSVLATSDAAVADMSAARSAKVDRVNEHGATVVTPAAAQPRQADQSVGTSGSGGTAAAPRRSARSRLPRTASNLAGFELLSALSLAGGFGLRQLRQRAKVR